MHPTYTTTCRPQLEAAAAQVLRLLLHDEGNTEDVQHDVQVCLYSSEAFGPSTLRNLEVCALSIA